MKLLDTIDTRITEEMKRWGIPVLRFSLALIFIWFGLLKVVGSSPAASLVAQTVYWVDPGWFVPFLGWWEVAIGVCFLFRPCIRIGIALLAPQMVGTFLPLVLLPSVVYEAGNPFLLTLPGQYIVKNLLIIGSAIMIGATVRQHRVVLAQV